MNQYILAEDGKTPIPCPNIKKWGMWFEKYENRRVRLDVVGEIEVSTIFIGLDHRFLEVTAKPVLWETMIFGGEHDQYQERYSSYEDALHGHEKAVKMVEEK